MTSKTVTIQELDVIEERIRKISEQLATLNEATDYLTAQELQNELNDIIDRLEGFLKASKRRHLRVIK